MHASLVPAEFSINRLRNTDLYTKKCDGWKYWVDTTCLYAFLDIPKFPIFIEITDFSLVHTHLVFSSGNPQLLAPGQCDHFYTRTPPGLTGHQAGWRVLLQLPSTDKRQWFLSVAVLLSRHPCHPHVHNPPAKPWNSPHHPQQDACLSQEEEDERHLVLEGLEGASVGWEGWHWPLILHTSC